MKALAIDTSNTFLSLAVCCGNDMVEDQQAVGQSHASLILPTIERLLKKVDVSIKNLDHIIYGQGPGAFTGLRIGASVAKGLAFPFDIALIPIPTLDAIAISFPQDTSVVVAIDARMQQVYWRSYQVKEKLIPQGNIQVTNPCDIAPAKGQWIGAGSGFLQYQDQMNPAFLSSLSGIDPQAKPSARAYLRLAQSGSYKTVSAQEASLLYIRNRVALTLQEQVALR